MPEISYKQIGGILALVIILTGGTTFYVQKTGEYNNCRGLWELQDDGQYKCEKTGELQYCYNVEYRGSGWYRCWVGKVTLEETPDEGDTAPGPSKDSYVCDSIRCV